MNITFLIGNGFDLSMGLKTQYKDFFRYYTSLECSEDCLKSFRETISSDIENWANAEIALGHYTDKFAISDIKSFKKCRDHFCLELASYLQAEDLSFDLAIFKSVVAPSFHKAIVNLTSFLLVQSAKQINSVFKKSFQEQHIYNFINFNYTSIFDRCLKEIVSDNNVLNIRKQGSAVFTDRLGEIVHIHGTTLNNLIMGVNDESQIANSDFLNVRHLKRALLKPLANDSNHLDNSLLCTQFVETSSIIVIFGMSLGETDNFWWQKIGSWLMIESRHLILFMYNTNYTEVIQSRYLEVEEEIQDLFFKNANVDSNDQEKLRSRIHVCVNMKLFGDDPHTLIQKN